MIGSHSFFVGDCENQLNYVNMEKFIAFAIMNAATSAILCIICFIFLFFVIHNLRGQNYSLYYSPYYSGGGSFWRRFGMTIMFIPFVAAIWYGIQVAPDLNLTNDGASIICTLAVAYFLTSCKVTNNEIWDLLIWWLNLFWGILIKLRKNPNKITEE